MKNSIFTILLVCLLQWNGYAQDTIVLRNGTEIKTKVLEVDGSEVKYKRFDNVNGPTYTAKKQTIHKIKYENGVEDIFTGTNRQLEQMKRKPQGKVQYAGLLELGQSLGSDLTNDDIVWGSSLTTAHGVKINDKYTIGIGVGVNVEYLGAYKERYVAMPIYATTQIDLSDNDAKPQIFVSASVGGQVGLKKEPNRTPMDHGRNKASGGVWASGMVGVRLGKVYVAAGPTVRSAHDTLKPGKYVAVGAMLAVGITL